MDSAEDCKTENIGTLRVPKEECKEEGDIETLLVPKEECEVGDIETLVVPKEEFKAGDIEVVRVLKEESESGKIEKQGQDLVGRFVQKDFKNYGLFIGKVVSYHPSQGFYRVKYDDGDREDLELHELRYILVQDSDLGGELNGRKQELEKLLQQESRKRSRTGQFQKRRQRPGKRERAQNGTDKSSGSDFSPWGEVGQCTVDGNNNPCKVDVGQVERVMEAEEKGNTEARKRTENTEAEARKNIENTDAGADKNIPAAENVKMETDGAVVGLECELQGREIDCAVKGSEFEWQGMETDDVAKGAESKQQQRQADGAVKGTDFKCEGSEFDSAVKCLERNLQGRETDCAVDGSGLNQRDMGTSAVVEDLDCKWQGNETDGVVEVPECMRQGRGKRKRISDDRRDPRQKRQRQCKSSLDGSPAVSSKLARQSQQRIHGKSGAEKVAFSSEDNSCEQKSELSEARESALKNQELLQPPRRRGRGKSRNGSSGSSQKDEVGIKLPHQTAVLLDQQKQRPQRNSARNTSVHIISQEGDSDIEKDNACLEESFHVSDKDAYSSSDASDTEDSGQILLSSKSNDFPLPPMKPLPQSSGDLPVPESSVPDLFSVYSCLRRFSNLLFLSPFTLDDFVGALNYRSANTLMDSVHICLLKAVRRHLETLSAEGNEKASKCFRQLDWNFLEAVTWPVYLVEYLSAQGFSSRLGQNILDLKLLNCEYYTILPSTKLKILQFLCDDIMEAEEVRTEINMRVNFEQDTDADTKMNFSSGATGLIARNPCYSKRKRVSCTKADGQRRSNLSQVTLEKTNFHSDGSTSQNKHSCSKNGQTEFMSPGMDDVEDFNSDECCLCGMDGNLICCDGCPSAYHFRCVGLSKAHLPEGEWYCPECAVEKIDSQGSRASKSLNGAEIFGIDPYGRVFFGTCGYLLVSDSASNPTATYRYYNKRDLTKVMETLELSGPFYDDIKNSILQYWGVAEGKQYSVFLQKTYMTSGNSPMALSCLSISEHLVEDASASGLLSVSSERKPEKDCSVHDHDHEGLHVSDTIDYDRKNELLVIDTSNFKETKIRSFQEATGVVPNSSVCGNSQECGNALEQQIDLDTDSTAMQIDFLKSSPIPGQQQAKEETSDMTGVQEDVSILNVRVVHKQTDDIGKAAVKMDMGTNMLVCKASFKPNAYINYYVLGDIAASAAANLASISVEDNRLVNRRGSFKKTLSATISEQVKIFSKAAVQFCWPSNKKKSMEPPKERCGWCASCKSTASCRRACLLNLAACNVMAGAASVPGGLRPTKNGEGHLPAVAAYILYIEDCLRGLVVGPWENLDYRKHWRRCLEQASTAKEIRASLLELEKNIRLNALAAGWTKHVDDWSPQVSAGHIGTSSAISAAKRGGNGKRPQKNSAPTVMAAPDARALKIFYWCKGGRFYTQVLQLPCAIAKQAGRQGGLRRIPGILYAEGSDIPRRTRQFTWRAAVERSRTVSELALQVRYLDTYIKWKDLVYPQDHCPEGKAVDKESASFRNATFCGKRYEGGEFKYLLDFGNQKEIPISAVKHGRKTEETEGSGNKYWLGESHVPLYLLKAFEDRLLQDEGSKQVWKVQNRLMKGIRNKNIFAFLLSKEEMNEKCLCAHCGMDILVRKAVKCNFCEGSFHQGCTVTSDWPDRSECNFTCYKCNNFRLSEKRDNILKATLKKSFAPLLMNKKVQDVRLPLYKVEEQKGSSAQSVDANTAVQKYPGVDRFLVQRRKPNGLTYQNGLLWKKSPNDEFGKDFRKRKLLLPCQNSMGAVEGPRCFLCRESYNPKLIYVGCEHCKEWFHGDALGLNQENIVQLGGFKCHRCRKKSGPVCPHAGRDSLVKRRKLPVKRSRKNVNRDHFENFNKVDSKPSPVLHSKPGQASNELRTTLDFAEQKFAMVKLEPVLEHSCQVSPSSDHLYIAESKTCQQSECSPLVGAEDLSPCQYIAESKTCKQSECSPLVGAEDLSPQVDWEFSVNDCLHDDQQIEFKEPLFECMEPYSDNEPLFSFTELLASEDDQVEDLVDLSQGIIEDSSDSLSNNKEIGICSQSLGVKPQGFPYNGLIIPSNTVENTGSELPNDFSQEKLMCFQLHGTANKVISEENKYDATGNTVSLDEFQMHGTANELVSEEIGKLCRACGLTVLPPDYQCEGCGMVIHHHCYEWQPLGALTASGWTCDSCQGGLIQDKGYYL